MLISFHILNAAMEAGVRRFLFCSSDWVYPQHPKEDPELPAVREEDGWVADPKPGDGLEKLYVEELVPVVLSGKVGACETQVVRFHNGKL